MNQLLRFPEVRKITGLSRSTIFRLERNGKFPKRKQISTQAVGWLLEEINKWIESRQSVNKEKRYA
ncbi:MAG: AlpA family phage regulatory protein [Gammaproteobacteria bacterium]|jgi:prophage regulatory protein